MDDGKIKIYVTPYYTYVDNILRIEDGMIELLIDWNIPEDEEPMDVINLYDIVEIEFGEGVGEFEETTSLNTEWYNYEIYLITTENDGYQRIKRFSVTITRRGLYIEYINIMDLGKYIGKDEEINEVYSEEWLKYEYGTIYERIDQAYLTRNVEVRDNEGNVIIDWIINP